MSPLSYGVIFPATLAAYRLLLGVPRPDFVWLALLHVGIYALLDVVRVFR